MDERNIINRMKYHPFNSWKEREREPIIPLHIDNRSRQVAGKQYNSFRRNNRSSLEDGWSWELDLRQSIVNGFVPHCFSVAASSWRSILCCDRFLSNWNWDVGQDLMGRVPRNLLSSAVMVWSFGGEFGVPEESGVILRGGVVNEWAGSTMNRASWVVILGGGTAGGYAASKFVKHALWVLAIYLFLHKSGHGLRNSDPG